MSAMRKAISAYYESAVTNRQLWKIIPFIIVPFGSMYYHVAPSDDELPSSNPCNYRTRDNPRISWKNQCHAKKDQYNIYVDRTIFHLFQ